MVRNELSDNENILVKVDQNNLVYIDPNSVVDKDGNIHPRGVKPENLIIYANLEADIIPRSILAATNDQNTLVSIAKGTLNFLSNQNGKDFDSSWTEAYAPTSPKNFKTENSSTGNSKEAFPDTFNKSDDSGQSFGIDSINVTIKGANAIPQVSINFIDVRGKTLFEGSENSPYNAFFHLPWPIFYLTLKGYYGKAIRYRLHLVKFSTKFNDSNGNFEVSTVFVGSTFAFLNDLSLKVIMNAAYMFPLDNLTDGTLNENTNNVSKKITKSTRGYQILKNIYAEYEKKNLVPKNFPVITLRELIVKAQTLDKILEREILYQKLHPDIFIGLQDFENKINDFIKAVRAWGRLNLKNNPQPDSNINYYDIKSLSGNTTNEKIVGIDKQGTLEQLLDVNNKQLANSSLFANELIDAAANGKTGGGNFKKENLLAKFSGKLNKYYKQSTNQVAIDLLVQDLTEVYNVFIQESNKLENTIELAMNEVLKDKSTGLGFEPTIRNIFAILLANADTYIRLMKDVHQKAYEQRQSRQKLLNNLSKETKGDPAIYPWPEIKKDSDNQKNRVIAYPGEKDLISKLKSNNSVLWPEVEFIENFIEVSTNKIDPLAEKENTTSPTTTGFDNDDNLSNTRFISTLGYISGQIPYIDTTPSSFLYEIYERANYYTAIDSFSNITLNELANIEFENISNAIQEDIQMSTILKEVVNSENKLYEVLQSFSPYERYPYYLDQLPTVDYIKDTLETSHEISEYNARTRKVSNRDLPGLVDNLLFYKPEEYRTKMYPYSSDLYLSYLGTNQITPDLYNFNEVLRYEPQESFITSFNYPNAWVKPNFISKSLFSNNLKINNTYVNILNTPYFHKQLYSDFTKQSDYARYAGSAYLLLTSLPFLDLEENIDFSGYLGINVSTFKAFTLFKEVGSTHYLPYHLICKWGAIYHRYKKYILDGVDILDGFLDTNNKTTAIDGSIFFNNNEVGPQFTGYTVSGNTVTYSDSKDVGIHPFYDAIFHQIINGYTHYNVVSGNTSFSVNVNAKAINSRLRKASNNLNYWTSYVDNSKFNSKDNRLTILPCDGSDVNINRKIQIPNLIVGPQIQANLENFESATQNYFKIIWEDNTINDVYTNRTFPTYDEYIKSYSTGSTNNGLYSLDLNNRKIIDLIGTFSPAILENFENIFLDFATQNNNVIVSQRFPNIKYKNFQELLKEMCSVNKESSDDTVPTEQVINRLKVRQKNKLTDISNDMLSTTNTLKFTVANPKEIDYHVWYGFSGVDNINTFSYTNFFQSQLTDKNKQLLKLYLGEDIDGYYQSFFIVNDVGLNETNILQFRPLIQIYAGYLKNGGTNTSDAFKDYLKENIFNYTENTRKTSGSILRRKYFLTQLIRNFTKLKNTRTTTSFQNIVSGYENDKLKLELYNYFKSFNDKWVSGNSIGQRLLLEEFLFLDKANKDIGDVLFLNLSRIISLSKQDFDKTNLYSIISILIGDSGIDMRPLPAYINFYGNNANIKNKITPSKRVANDLFGQFLEVDYQESSPKIILQLVGNTSKHPDIINKKYKFADDSFNIASSTENPIIITAPEVFNNADLSKSNRAVAFEVSFGDQNQGIFKGVSLDQTTLKNTTESFVVIENLARSESGAGAYNVDISLFDYYRQASYTCDVTCMGNAMIQPTMFFYLKNIPMFTGSYWITEVSHQIRGNNFTTTFKGTRISKAALPDPKDSFISSYRVLFDKLRKDVIKKQSKSATGSINESATIESTDGKTYRVNIGQEAFGEDFDKIKVNKAGYNEFGVLYNGYGFAETVQLVKYAKAGEDEKEWLRARVYQLGSAQFPLDASDPMTIVTNLNDKKGKTVFWSEISGNTKTDNFYSLKMYRGDKTEITFDKMFTAKTTFVNPQTRETITVLPSITGEAGSRRINGLVDGNVIVNFGIGLSYSLLNKLALNNGSIVYFRME